MITKTKKAFKLFIMFLLMLAVAFVMIGFVGCGDTDGGNNDPFGDSDTVDKNYDYTVTIVGTKTQTVTVKSGATLEASKPLGIPKKSGERFIGWFADGEESEYDWTRKVTKDLTIRARFEKATDIDVLNGTAFPMTGGGIETGANDTLVIYTQKEQSSRISFTMKTATANSDDGIVFGLTPPEEESDGVYWETGNTSYYFFFVGENGNARLAKIEGGWNEPFISVANVDVKVPDLEYRLDVLINGNVFDFFVNGERVFTITDDIKLEGDSYGIRAKTAGTVYTEHDVADKHTVIMEGAVAGLQFVTDGSPAVKPEDPVMEGYEFDGWYVGNGDTEYDWNTPVTEDITITAKFIDDVNVRYVVTQGAAQDNGSGYVTTENKTLILTKDEFTEGSVSATVKPGSANNDCGIIFGANVTSGAKWENFDYYMVLINRDGVLFLSRTPWEIIAETRLSSFSIMRDYTVTVKYNAQGGYAEVYVDGSKMLSASIGELFGTRVGYRADNSYTVFGYTDIDDTDIPDAPIKNVGDYTVRNGKLQAGENGDVTSAENQTLAVLTDKTQGNVISYTMTQSAYAANGIVFCLTDNGAGAYWEGTGTSYYFFFIGDNGNARLAEVKGGWKDLGEAVIGSVKRDYRLEVLIDGNKINCFVDGVKCFTYNAVNKLSGTSYGIRCGAEGVTYAENDNSDKHTVVIDGAVSTLEFVADGTVLTKPADPVKIGYIFRGWYVGDAETEYDWATPVTGDITVTAKFDEDTGVTYTLTQGTVSETDYGFKTTSDNTLIMLKQTFAQGSLEAKVKPMTKNDCGIVFGANVTEGATWENFDYFTVLLNLNGTILFARVNTWGVMASSAVLESGFDPAREHTIKVVYKDGFAKVYGDGLLAMTVYIGELKGNGVGFRAQKTGTEFSENVVIDGTAAPNISAANRDITLIKRTGGSEMTVESGVYTSTGADTVYTSDNTVLERGGMLSVTIDVSGAQSKNTCNGIIFGVPSGHTTGDLWETVGRDNYYFFFISDDGLVRLTVLSPWEGNEIKGDNVIGGGRISNTKVDITQEHTLTVSWDGNGVTCFADGEMYFALDSKKLAGGVFGLRAQAPGVTYKDFTVVSYKETESAGT